jgi:hypothetical protein
MKFSWKAVALAPLPAPFAFTFLISGGAKNPVLAFLFLFALSSLFSYGAALGVFLPGLYCFSKLTRLQFYKVSLVGFFLGILVYLPMSWIFYCSSGPDSGPPEGTYLAYLVRSWTDAGTWLFPISGLITAVIYWLLAKDRSPRELAAVNG